MGNWFTNLFGIGSGDPSNYDRSQLDNNGAAANSFGQTGAANYGQANAGMNQDAQYLQGQANGANSVSAEQLRQGLQQGLAQQQSAAAGASPNNAAMAARNAAMNMNQMSTAALGQQAQAGLQERNQANQALANVYGQQGQLAVNAATGGMGNANQSYGTAVANPQKTWGSTIMGGLSGLAAGLVKSDRRAKTGIEDGDGKSSRILEGLRSYSYKYKDEKHGKGEQFGIMAQDLEKAGLKHAVIDTPSGKYVDGAKAATASLGLVAALARRVGKLEGGRK